MKIYHLALLLVTVNIYSQTQIGQDLLGDRINEEFGYSVDLSMDGQTLAIGNRDSNPNNEILGEVEVFNLVNNQWVKKGSSLFGIENEAFGNSIKLSDDGNTIIIGSPSSSVNGINSGRVRVYFYDGTDWVTKGQTLFGNNSDSLFGFDVDISSDGNRVAISSPANNLHTGAVTVFSFDGNIWDFTGNVITGDNTASSFGQDISLSDDGNTIVIGAPSDDTTFTNAGLVKVYELQNGLWNQKGADLFGNAFGIRLGFSVTTSSNGNKIGIGAPFDSLALSEAGKVHFYEYINQNWVETGNGISGDAAEQRLGDAVELSSDGNVAIILSAFSNSATVGYISTYQFNGTDYQEVGNPVAINGPDSTISLSNDGTTFISGNYFRTGDVGLVEVYSLTNVLSVVENDFLNFSVYPNPASERVYVSLKDSSSLESITVLDTLGKYITSTNDKYIDVSKLKPGVYFFKISLNNKEITTKIVVQ